MNDTLYINTTTHCDLIRYTQSCSSVCYLTGVLFDLVLPVVEKYLLTSRQVILVNGEFGMETGKLSWANSYTR